MHIKTDREGVQRKTSKFGIIYEIRGSKFSICRRAQNLADRPCVPRTLTLNFAHSLRTLDFFIRPCFTLQYHNNTHRTHYVCTHYITWFFQSLRSSINLWHIIFPTNSSPYLVHLVVNIPPPQYQNRHWRQGYSLGRLAVHMLYVLVNRFATSEM
jgi:hypothetical protein